MECEKRDWFSACGLRSVAVLTFPRKVIQVPLPFKSRQGLSKQIKKDDRSHPFLFGARNGT